MLTRRYGADLCFTQMFNANSMVSSTDYCEENFQTTQGDRPLIVQIAGHDPQVMLQAAKLLEDHCDAIDINLGCPQGIAKRGRYGAFLMEELELLGNIVQTLSKNLKVPVTCKTRIYKGQGGFERSVRLCETLVGAGASMLTIHGRTREEKGQQVGASDWSTLKRLKEHFKDRGVPIIANGGIETLQDVHECLKVTGCDGVMSSEAILENPRMFDAAAVHTAESQLGTSNPQQRRSRTLTTLYQPNRHSDGVLDPVPEASAAALQEHPIALHEVSVPVLRGACRPAH